jgi:hypothetical protein
MSTCWGWGWEGEGRGVEMRGGKGDQDDVPLGRGGAPRAQDHVEAMCWSTTLWQDGSNIGQGA